MTMELPRPLHRLTPLRDDPLRAWLSPAQRAAGGDDRLGRLGAVRHAADRSSWWAAGHAVRQRAVRDRRAAADGAGRDGGAGAGVADAPRGDADAQPQDGGAGAPERARRGAGRSTTSRCWNSEPDGRWCRWSAGRRRATACRRRWRQRRHRPPDGRRSVHRSQHRVPPALPGRARDVARLRPGRRGGNTVLVQMADARMLGASNVNLTDANARRMLIASLDLPVGAVATGWDAYGLRDGDPVMVVGFKQVAMDPTQHTPARDAGARRRRVAGAAAAAAVPDRRRTQAVGAFDVWLASASAHLVSGGLPSPRPTPLRAARATGTSIRARLRPVRVGRASGEWHSRLVVRRDVARTASRRCMRASRTSQLECAVEPSRPHASHGTPARSGLAGGRARGRPAGPAGRGAGPPGRSPLAGDRGARRADGRVRVQLRARAQRLGDARPAAPVPGVVAVLHLVDDRAAVCGAWRPSRWPSRTCAGVATDTALAAGVAAAAAGGAVSLSQRPRVRTHDVEIAGLPDVVRRLSHRADLRPALRPVRQRPPRRRAGSTRSTACVPTPSR